MTLKDDKERRFAAGVPLVIITGLSGAGKSTAMRCFEDLGCFCVDNLPPGLVPTFYGLYKQSIPAGPGAAIASDLRSGALFADFSTMVETLKKSGVKFEVLYLDCSTDTLIHRFSEVRRQHPLQHGRSTEEAIEEERRRLEPVREVATRIIDTSELSAAALREAIIRSYVSQDTSDAMKLEFVSFGFKYGVPLNADFVFDVRFLPNPFYIPELSQHTGEHPDVYDFVMNGELAEEYFKSITGILDLTLESFIKVGKFNLTVAVGCTGGHHRSVAYVKRLADYFSAQGHSVAVIHRDSAKPQN
ncbi:MAG: RNase adapter RapZ [bacterium]|jgi:UPF0042 nucleotide-binding protein